MIIRIFFLLLLLGPMLFAPTATAQQRDHLTAKEVDLVKEAQVLDKRIDDVSARDERNPLIAKSLRKLANAVNTIMVELKPLRGEAKSDAEIASFELLNEDAQSILEAATKLPAEVEKKAKAKNK